MKSKKPRPAVHVLDTSVWIELLVPKHQESLDKLLELTQLGACRIGITPTIRAELNDLDPQRLAERKRSWNSRISELENCVRHLQRVERLNDDDSLLESLLKIRRAIQDFHEDPAVDALRELVDGDVVVHIPEPKVLHTCVVEHGLNRKKPFATKNGTADTLILLAVARWARRNANDLVVFHTMNSKDFCAPSDATVPHPDIEEHFSANLSLVNGLEGLSALVGGLDPLDFYPRDPFSCMICGENVLIESISCCGCGNWPDGAPDDEGYELTAYREGHLVDVHPYDGEPFRLSCGVCGRKTFLVELADLCSYHTHVSEKEA